MKSSKVFWGIFFILAAVYVVISKFGILPDIGVFSIILTVFFLWLFVEGIRNVNFWEILFSIAFICIIYDEPLGITALTPWTVLGAASRADLVRRLGKGLRAGCGKAEGRKRQYHNLLQLHGLVVDVGEKIGTSPECRPAAQRKTAAGSLGRSAAVRSPRMHRAAPYA